MKIWVNKQRLLGAIHDHGDPQGITNCYANQMLGCGDGSGTVTCMNGDPDFEKTTDDTLVFKLNGEDSEETNESPFE